MSTMKVISGKFIKNTNLKIYNIELSHQIQITVPRNMKFDHELVNWIKDIIINQIQNEPLQKGTKEII